MAGTGLINSRACTAEGFYYDNLLKMAQHCREGTEPEKFLGAYVMEKAFTDLAAQLGDRPLLMDCLSQNPSTPHSHR